MHFSSQALWRIVRFILMVQILNAILDTLMWASYDFSIPASTVAGLTVFFTVLLVTIKVAAEKMTSKTEPEHLR